MELNQLKTFIAVAEEKHLTRAAERLYTSQPAVSAQLKSLEEFLGLRLFDRTPKGMTLTPAGEQLLKQACLTLDAAKQMADQAKSIQGKVMGTLKIGVNSDFPFLRVPQLLASCNLSYPGIKLSFINSMSADIIADVRKGRLDAGFFFGPCSSADLHISKLAEVETAVVAPVGWAERILGAGIVDLAALPWVYTTERCPFFLLKEALFSRTESNPDKAVFVDTEEGIRELIRSGSGISLLRRDDADKAEHEGWGVRWDGETPTCPLHLATHVNRVREPLILALLEQLEQCWLLDQGKAARDVI